MSPSFLLSILRYHGHRAFGSDPGIVEIGPSMWPFYLVYEEKYYSASTGCTHTCKAVTNFLFHTISVIFMVAFSSHSLWACDHSILMYPLAVDWWSN